MRKFYPCSNFYLNNFGNISFDSYNYKGNIQWHSNYRGIKLMRHTIKFQGRVCESRIKDGTIIMENQYGFMFTRLTIDVYLMIQLIQKYRENKDLHKFCY